MESILNRFVSNSNRVIIESKKSRLSSLDDVTDEKQVLSLLKQYKSQINNLESISRTGDFRKSNLQGIKFVFSELVRLTECLDNIKEKAKSIRCTRETIQSIDTERNRLISIRKVSDEKRKEMENPTKKETHTAEQQIQQNITLEA